MAKYKVNLEPVWNLPIGTGCARSSEDEYCAIGLVAAGIFGADNVPIVTQWKGNNEYTDFRVALDKLGIGTAFVSRNFDDAITRRGEDPEIVRERCVREILQKGMEAGIFELEDADLEIVRELKSLSRKPVEVS